MPLPRMFSERQLYRGNEQKQSDDGLKAEQFTNQMLSTPSRKESDPPKYQFK